MQSPVTLPLVEAALNGRGDGTISREIAERIEDVLDALDERLAATESRLDALESSVERNTGTSDSRSAA
jgi:hypothetical protein